MLACGPSRGEAIGEYRGEPLYRASLDGAEYRALLDANGFEIVDDAVEDPSYGRHVLWLAKLREMDVRAGFAPTPRSGGLQAAVVAAPRRPGGRRSSCFFLASFDSAANGGYVENNFISMGAVMTRATFGVWGKTLAVRISAEIVELAGFAPGESIEISGRRGEIVIRRSPASALAEMFAAKSPKKWRALYAGSDPWGPDVGREIVEP